jgi:hypothetical protein
LAGKIDIFRVLTSAAVSSILNYIIYMEAQMKIKSFIMPFLVIAAVTLTAASCAKNPASAPAGTSVISGTVYKQDCCSGANPYYTLADCGVELFRSASLLRNTTTDVSGNYIFQLLAAGTYDVVAVIPTTSTIMSPATNLNSSGWESTTFSYHATSVRVTRSAVSVADDETVTVDFRFMGY